MLKTFIGLLGTTFATGAPLTISQETEFIKNPDQHLIFAFEVVRHGARAPLDDKKVSAFTVGEG